LEEVDLEQWILGCISRFPIKALANHGIVLGETVGIVEEPGRATVVIQLAMLEGGNGFRIYTRWE
jgi:hypothetical protein